MLPVIEFIIVFLVSFGFNLIPFAGPSNLFIASTATIGLGNTDFASLLIIGILVALGATLAKGIHYGVTFFVSGHLNEKRRTRLDSDAQKIKKWAFMLLYLAAATPIPDEPIVIPLGLMKYSVTKFFLSYFLGKLTITVLGAFMGNKLGHVFSSWLSPEIMVVISVVLTVIITVILLKVDLGKLARRFMKKKVAQSGGQENLEKIN
jgi:membrane protein DedA with SNARE-associated domain